jgi:NAD(P)-dependent dehydrogenase (short-subunit alcohol dehydrogenase family)
MGKDILITGCSCGFGSDAARHLAGKGHRVYATMRDLEGRNKAAADALRDVAADMGASLTALEMDVTSDNSVEAAVSGIPNVDILINNAGLGYGDPVEAFSSEQILRQIDVNVVRTTHVAKAAPPGSGHREGSSGWVSGWAQ